MKLLEVDSIYHFFGVNMSPDAFKTVKFAKILNLCKCPLLMRILCYISEFLCNNIVSSGCINVKGMSSIVKLPFSAFHHQ